MTEKIKQIKLATPQKIKLKMGQFEPTLKIFLFLKARIINFFLIPVTQTYQNENVPIFYYGKVLKRLNDTLQYISKAFGFGLLKLTLTPSAWLTQPLAAL